MQVVAAHPAVSKRLRRALLTTLGAACLLSACVPHTYQPGLADNPLHQLQLGQSYGDMVRVLGEPDQSRSEDRSGKEAVLLFIPGWNLVEWFADFNPSSLQIYTYMQYGTVTIDDSNRIIRVEAR